MLSVDRGNYTNRSPYADSPQGIGFGATISAPHMHAHCLELIEKDGFLQTKQKMRILDVGCGSGYLCSAFAHLIGKDGKVVGIDHVPGLVDLAQSNISKDHAQYLKEGRIELIVGDGRLGYPQGGPYDVIHVGAAAYPVPESLLAQLKSPGRMLIPVGKPTSSQELVMIGKDVHGELTRSAVMGVVYVPLTDVEHQLQREI